MKNLNIGVRLGLGFALVILLLVVVSAIGILHLNTSRDITREIVYDRYQDVVYSNNVKNSANASGHHLRNALLAATTQEQKPFLDLRAEAGKITSENLAKLEKAIHEPAALERFNVMVAERDKFLAAQAQVIKLLEEGNKSGAIASLFNEAMPRQEVFFEAIDKMVAHQTGAMDHSAEMALEDVHEAIMQVAGFASAAAVAALLSALFIGRSITVPMAAAVSVAEAVAKGDLTTVVDVRSKDEIGRLLQALKDMNASLLNIVGDVRNGTDAIATASGQIAAGNLDLSSRTEQQASSLEETASSMEELTSTVRQNADNARQANGLAASASDVALKGGMVVSQVVGTMGSINESAKKIVDIIGVIDGIAFQTNILALNAAVEAARAGEQGRGFAVVASEVRNLAQRSAAAAKEIKLLISDSVEQVAAGSKLVDQAGATMGEIVSSVKRVADIMAEITAASQEQSVGIEQVNQAIAEMDQVTQQNAALVEEAAATAESLQGQASKLVESVGVFRTDSAAAPARSAQNRAPLAKAAARAPVRLTLAVHGSDRTALQGA